MTGVEIASPIAWHVLFLTDLSYFEVMTPSASSLYHYKTSSKSLILGCHLSSAFAHSKAAAASGDGIKNPTLQTVSIACLITSATGTNNNNY